MKTKDRVVFLDNEEKTGTIKTIKGNICVVHTDAGNIMAPLSMLRVVEEYVSPTVPESPSCDTEPQAAQEECTLKSQMEGADAPTYTVDNKYIIDREGDLYVSVNGIYLPAELVCAVDANGQFVAKLSVTPAQYAALSSLPLAHEVTLDVYLDIGSHGKAQHV